MIADNYPQIPDRTNAIFGKSEDPTDDMIASAKRLERAKSGLYSHCMQYRSLLFRKRTTFHPYPYYEYAIRNRKLPEQTSIYICGLTMY